VTSYFSAASVLSVSVRAFRTPDLRKKLLFTGAMIVLFRFGSNLPAPGAVSLVVVCAGIGVPLGLSGPGGKPPQHNPGQRPDQHSGSVTLVPHARAGAALIIERPAPVLTAAAA